MDVPVPPRGARLKFWLLGLRLAPEHSQWVASQVVARGFFWRTQARIVVLILLVHVAVSAAVHDFRGVDVYTVPLLAGLLLGALGARALMNDDRLRQRWLAYHRTTADGVPTGPAPALSWEPWGKPAVVLFTVQMTVLSVGVAVIAADYVRTRDCHSLRPADAAALTAAIGQAGRPGEPGPLVPPGTALIAARSVDDQALPGIRYAAAYVRDSAGTLLGPGTWRFIDPMALGSDPLLSVSSTNPLAEQITPDLGRSSSDPEPRAAIKALGCAEAALS